MMNEQEIKALQDELNSIKEENEKIKKENVEFKKTNSENQTKLDSIFKKQEEDKKNAFDKKVYKQFRSKEEVESFNKEFGGLNYEEQEKILNFIGEMKPREITVKENDKPEEKPKNDFDKEFENRIKNS